ncbi:hypothetical protein [Agromyces sp. ISL-38]|uniref:hypothetical protein n=1 Tax=Agromyces sp. ISL-38 TaxID=2819107 RepID=UPI0020357ABC|nr:hypothetical protein [Agromyces sp. ISL-38]
MRIPRAIFAAAATAGVLAVSLAGGALPANAVLVDDPSGSVQSSSSTDNCAGLDSGKIDTKGDPVTVTATAPEGQLIDGYCVKAGTVAYYYDVVPPQAEIEFKHPDKDSVSHWSVSYVDGSFTEPTLTGSLAGECVANAPWIVYDVVLNDPDGVVATDVVSLVFTDGTSTETIELGTLVDGKLSGKALWPGATVAEDGVTPTGWPGWAFVGGKWVVTDDNFGWTRDVTEVKLVVNPELTVALDYPAATADCAPPAPGGGTGGATTTTTTTTTTTSLASTGFNGGLIGIVAGVLAVAGLALLVVTWVRRRRA